MNFLFSLTLATVSLHDVAAPELKDQEIEIRGFLHEMPEGQLVLSSQPNVRSCCKGEKHPKVVVEGEFDTPPKAKAVTVRGKLVEKDDHYAIEKAMLLP